MKRLFVLFITSLCINMGNAQSNASYKPEIDAFLQEDSMHFPPRDAIEFVGSSSIRKWKDIQSYFPGYTIINRGFGGCRISNVLHYADQIIYPYHPKQVIIYCGDNDFAYDKAVSVRTVFDRFKALFYQIRSRLPNVNIGYISIKYSPSRNALFSKMKFLNHRVALFLQKQTNAEFIDANEAMLDGRGKVDIALYQQDMLHLNAAGYKVWQRIIEPYLLK